MGTIDERFKLQGKVAVIAGGGGHLGSTLAQAMRESGMTVIILDVGEPSEGEQPDATGLTHVKCDVTSKASLIECRDAIVREHRRIDVLLNAAGTNAPTPFFEISESEFERIVKVNLLGTLHGCQVFGETMLQRGAGSIINFASLSIGPPLSKAFIYSTAKAGVFNLTQNLAREWAASGVRVNALRPGFFPTDWSMRNFIDEDRKRKILGHTPMGRFGKPEELVGAVLWLASDAASFVTGSLITIDGGFSAMSI